MEVSFLNQNPCIPSCPGVFQFDIFLVTFWVVRCVFPLRGLPRVLLVLSSYRLFIQLFRYAFSVAIFSSKIVRFLWCLVFVSFCVIPSQLLIESSFVILECPIMFVLFYPFNLPSFARTFWFISLNCSVIFSRVVFCILFPQIPGSSCFTILVCFRRFFYLGFLSNFPSWFWQFLRAFWGDPNFLTH